MQSPGSPFGTGKRPFSPSGIVFWCFRVFLFSVIVDSQDFLLPSVFCLPHRPRPGQEAGGPGVQGDQTRSRPAPCGAQLRSREPGSSESETETAPRHRRQLPSARGQWGLRRERGPAAPGTGPDRAPGRNHLKAVWRFTLWPQLRPSRRLKTFPGSVSPRN